MPITTDQEPLRSRRAPLSRERVLRAAIDLADREGIDALTMRRLGEELDVEAMSLYNHVDNKDDLLNGVVDMIVLEIEQQVDDQAPAADDWKAELRSRILAARSVIVKHPWSTVVFESRTDMSPILTAYFDRLIGIMHGGGLSWDLAHHGMHALGSRALGFTQELFVPDDDGETEMTSAAIQQMASVYPNIAGMLEVITHDDVDTLGWCDDQTEFVFGLDLLLDGLERHHEAERP